jgi:hypothetical protein
VSMMGDDCRCNLVDAKGESLPVESVMNSSMLNWNTCRGAAV